MKNQIALFAVFAASLSAIAQSQPSLPTNPPAPAILVREARYDATLGEQDARFTVELDAECAGKAGGSLVVVEGEVAFVPAKLPDPLSVTREGNRYMLVAARGGRIRCKLDFVARIQRVEPWNQVSFVGPAAAIASVTAQAGGGGMEVQLLTGTVVETTQTNGVSRVRGLLGADRTVSLRWQGKVAEVARKTLLTADSTITALVTPTVVKYATRIRYDILQGNAPRLTLALPASHALTRLVGDQIRDWHVTAASASILSPSNDAQILTIEFIKPAERHTELTLFSEQTLDSATGAARLAPPQPLEVERDTGLLTLNAEDIVAETDSLAGLRQVNAPGGALAAYRFSSRPFTLALRLQRVAPRLGVEDRITTRLEEKRLMIAHRLSLTVEQAGLYALELHPQAGLTVAEVRGEGVEDWKVANGKLWVNFASRLLGPRQLDVQLEQALQTFPESIRVAPLRVAGAVKETAHIGAASSAGIRLKVGDLSGLREVPVNRLADRSDELLAFVADQPDWQLALASERLAPRIVASVFNLVTIGDGLVGGSATIRYGIANQGVQEFRVRLPAHCKNVEFTGPNIRRREQSGDTWTIGLQDKAWGGYTLVVTYDYPFDPQGATLPVAGIHALEVERETGSVAITTAASLKLSAPVVGDPLRRVDESELAAADRALITRAVVLAYQYNGGPYDLAVSVKRHEPITVLDAVADRTQITSVLTEAGEMLTQASFMVKNNAKQFQRFQLPKGSDFWGCYVNGQAVKPERDGDWVLVPLPREANRDQAFAVDIVYARTNAALNARWSQPIQFAAPITDVPNTYAEWQLYVPASKRLSNFGGTMRVAEGTTYGPLDAWRKFITFYGAVLHEAGPALAVGGVLAVLVVALVMFAARRGGKGVVELLVVVAIMAILAGMMLPALSKAKQKAQRINSANNLKQVGLAFRIWSADNEDRFPMSFEEMLPELGTDKVTYDPETGQRYTYLGAGLKVSEVTPDSVIAYSPIVNGHCNVLLADGSVQQITAARFAEYSQRGLVRHLKPEELAAQQQAHAVQTAQLPTQQSPIVAASQADAPPPSRTRGLRSIRIELPREGNAFTFAKVLNLRDEPLSISARLMPLDTYRNVLMAKQVAAFLLGLAAWWWQWRGRRNSLLLTCALTLMLGSFASLLVAWRALHDALIVGFPAVVLAAISWLIWRARAKHRAAK
ncbi:MAG TPA: type II secretion system protein, partial [Verrucomicrobiae bacterium]